MLGISNLRRHLSRITTVPLLLAFWLMCTCLSATAVPQNITKEEWAMIPPYCPYTLTFGNSGGDGAPSPGARPWVEKLGKPFWALHHYCWAEINLLRALRNSTRPQERKHLLGTVIDDYQFVIRNSDSSFILRPEIHTRIGEVELRLSRYGEAQRSFATARALRPDYWPAYSHWAEFLIKTGNQAEAKRLVKEGLEYSPNAKLLREQYRQLGGNPSAIVPKRPKTEEKPAPNLPDDTFDQLLSEEPATPATAPERSDSSR